MNRTLRRILRFTAYSGASVIIVLAVAVGLFRLLLPQLPEYQQEIKQRISEFAGVTVEFSSLDARWRFSGPELLFRDLALSDPQSGQVLLEAQETAVGASLGTLLAERKLSVNRISVRASRIDISRTPKGELLIEGQPLAAFALPATGSAPATDLRFLGEEIVVSYSDPTARRNESEFVLENIDYRNVEGSESLAVNLRPRGDARATIAVEANRQGRDRGPAWSIFIEGEGIELGDYLLALPSHWPVPINGSGAISLWLDVVGTRIVRSNANVELRDIAIAVIPGESTAILADAAGSVEWSQSDDIVVAGFDFSELVFDGHRWEPTKGRVELLRTQSGATGQMRVGARFLDLADLWRFSQWLPEEWQQRTAGLGLSGEIRRLEVEVRNVDESQTDYDIDAEFSSIGFNPIGGWPGVNGISGSVRAEPDSGRLLLSTEQFEIDDPRYFNAALKFRSADGGVTWRRGSRGMAVLSDRLTVRSDAFESDSNFELQMPNDGGSPSVDLITSFEVGDVALATRYLPEKIMRPLLYSWLVDALQSGRIADGSLILNGELRAFPFDDAPGDFAVTARVEDARLKFSGDWPAIDIESATTVLDGLRLYTKQNSASILGNPARNTSVEIANLIDAEIHIEADGRSQLSDALALARSSPIADVLGPRIQDVRAEGVVRIGLELDYPIRNRDEFEFVARLGTDDATAQLLPLQQRLTALSGEATITRDSINSSKLTGRLLGSEVGIELLPSGDDTGYRAMAVVSGAVAGNDLQQEFDSRLLDSLSGTTDYRATVRFPSRAQDTGKPLLIRLESELDGLGVGLPRPIGKSADESKRLQLDTSFPADGTIAISGQYGADTGLSIVLNKSDNGWRLSRGNIHGGPGRSVLPVGRGLFIDGSVAYLRLSDWLNYLASLELEPGPEPVLRAIDLRVEQAYAYGQRADNIAVKVDRSASDWLVQLASERIAGSIFVPLDLESGRALVLQMERLILTEADPEAGAPGDPRRLPPIKAQADAFALGEQRYGAVEAEIRKSESGLEATSLTVIAESFAASGTGAWLAVGDETQRTRLQLAVTSNDTAETGAQLGFGSGIAAERASASIDASWQGPPRRDFFDSLDGSFSILIEDGRLDEVDPGAGRLLGLMSVVELPRRLALDFTDVFSKGLSFNRIAGDYRIVNGEAYTCNLSLQGPAADIALIGRTGLAKRDYNQTAVVSANVGNTLPAVGAVVGGPQVAAAILVLSRIFKKPLKDLGQVYYQINGSWDEPTIERTSVERFYATSQLADCIQDGT